MRSQRIQKNQERREAGRDAVHEDKKSIRKGCQRIRHQYWQKNGQNRKSGQKIRCHLLSCINQTDPLVGAYFAAHEGLNRFLNPLETLHQISACRSRQTKFKLVTTGNYSWLANVSDGNCKPGEHGRLRIRKVSLRSTRRNFHAFAFCCL